MNATITQLLDTGSCVGLPESLFFRPRGRKRSGSEDGRAICGGCPLVAECLEQQLSFEWGIGRSYRVGIWGNTTPQQRFTIEQQRRKEAKS